MATSVTGSYWHILAVLLGLTLSFGRHVPVSAAVNESQGQAKVMSEIMSCSPKYAMPHRCKKPLAFAAIWPSLAGFHPLQVDGKVYSGLTSAEPTCQLGFLVLPGDDIAALHTEAYDMEQATHPSFYMNVRNVLPSHAGRAESNINRNTTKVGPRCLRKLECRFQMSE